MSARDRLTTDSRTLLSCIPLFAGLSAERLRRLGAASRLIELPAHHLLFHAGDSIREAYFLVSGSIKRATILLGGTEKVVELVQSGQMLGIGELFSAANYCSFAETLSASAVIAIGADAFRHAVREDTELAARVVEIMARRQCAIEFEVGNHHALTVAQRVLDYLVEMAGERLEMAGETTVRLDPSKRLIAARIGMAPETFSRTLRMLVESGAIVVDGRKVHIQNAILAAKGSKLGPERMCFPRKPKSTGGDHAARISLAELINLCGKQRMLSQRMAMAWVMIGRKLSPVIAKAVLRRTSLQFERNLARLGHLKLADELGARLARLQAVWPVYRQLLLDHVPTKARAAQAFAVSETILDAADQLTHAAELCFGTPEAHRINVAGRNRMISQRLTKLVLFRDWPVCADEARDYIRQSRPEFELNLDELRADGAGIPEVAAQLNVVAEQWRQFTDLIDAIPERSSNSGHALALLASREELLRHVDTTVKLYERLAG